PHTMTDAAGRTRTTIRVRRPLADRVTAIFTDGTRLALEHASRGIWEVQHDGSPVPYRIGAVYDGGEEQVSGDPYRHKSTLGDLDLHLIAEGRHERLWEVLGAN